MKKIVLIFGLISGALMAIFMFATMPFIDKIGFDKGVIVGYTNIVLAFILVSSASDHIARTLTAARLALAGPL